MKFKEYNKDKAFSLVEIMIVVAVIGIAFLGIVKGYFGIARGLLITRQKSAPTTLAQEQVETIKQLAYPKVYVTTQDDLDDYGYDNTYFPPVTYVVGSKEYTRYIRITKLTELNGILYELDPSEPDMGLKSLQVDIDYTIDGATKTYSLFTNIQDPDRTELSGSISGTARDTSDLSNIQGAEIYVIENANWTDNTDINGAFEISLPTGSWNLGVMKTGYLPTTNGPYAIIQDAVTTVPLGDLDIESVATESIWGLVQSTSGIPIEGAVVTCDDETSSSAVSLSTNVYGNPNQNYVISNVSTGTWTVSASTGSPLNLYGSSSTIIVLDGFSTNCDVALSSTTDYGSIAGVANMTDTGDDSGIKITASGVVTWTDTSGNYKLNNVSTGVVTVNVNSSAYSTSYTSNRTTVTVSIGQTANAGQLDIYPAGGVSGTVYTVGGVDPFPNIPVVAIDASKIERGVDLSQSDGSYNIQQLPVFGNTYTIEPIIDDEDIASPSDISVDVSKGVDDSGNDFTITPSWGFITGTLTYDGEDITDGVVVIASTYTFGASPPDIYLGDTGIYGGVSYSEGEYSIRVRSGYTYDIYAWYTELSGNGTETTMLSDTGVTLSGTPPSAEVDFDW